MAASSIHSQYHAIMQRCDVEFPEGVALLDEAHDHPGTHDGCHMWPALMARFVPLLVQFVSGLGLDPASTIIGSDSAPMRF